MEIAIVTVTAGRTKKSSSVSSGSTLEFSRSIPSMIGVDVPTTQGSGETIRLPKQRQSMSATQGIGEPCHLIMLDAITFHGKNSGYLDSS